jgi:hypothetical protein
MSRVIREAFALVIGYGRNGMHIDFDEGAQLAHLFGLPTWPPQDAAQ